MSLILHLSFDDLPPGPVPAAEEMDSSTAANLMTSYFTTSWSATAVRLDNEQSPIGEGAASWVSILILPVEKRQATLGRSGNRKWFRRDVFQVTIATPKDKGIQDALDLSGIVVSLFEGYRNGGLYVTGAPVRRLGNDGRWFRVVVDVTFNYHELK